MSHVTGIDCDVTDLEAMKAAGALCGVELVKQENYRWWGHHVGDYPIPEGFTKEDLGKCEYVLRIPNNPQAYEVGIVKRKDGRPGYTMLFDFYGHYGRMMEHAIGKRGSKLKQEYALAVGMKKMARQGFRVERTTNPATNKPRMRAWRA